ncbi:MAG: hypothetical protein DHS20C21_10000 [Gemmatimonadota bacterium]|nr:MAG: hypothetical protein DHS20C21_10000 [Gemmatimonadota bacterium]
MTSTSAAGSAREPQSREALVVSALAPGEEAAWDAFVRSRPDSSHYHRAGWARVIRNAFGRRTFYRVARRGAQIEGVLPLVAFAHPLFGRFLVSIPFMNRGGILSGSDEATAALVEDAKRLVAETRSDFCELRHVERALPELPVREKKISMSLPLHDDLDLLWKDVGSKVRNLVRKAEKADLKARHSQGDQDLDAFYDVFVENMRDLGTPVYSGRFFREVFREFPDDVRMTVVEKDGRVAAAGICVAQGGFTEIHWAASRRDMLRSSPNMLLYWECISTAAREGLTEFCFGRSTEDSGPYRFKKQWGAQPTPLHWEYILAPGKELPEINPDNPKYRAAIRVWQRLPMPVTRWLGPPIVRHLP